MTNPHDLPDPHVHDRPDDRARLPHAGEPGTPAQEQDTRPETEGSATRRASEFATHGDPTLNTDEPETPDGRRGVQWVRPTDLAARAGGVVLERGAEWNTRLRDAALEGIREGRAQLMERLARRQEHLGPDTIAQEQTAGRQLGRTGVSR